MRICLLIIALSFLFGSCSSLKKIQYLNDQASLAGIATGGGEYRIKAGDNLYVRIKGSTPIIVPDDNLGFSTFGSESAIDLLSYTVGEDGCIALPLLGKIEVKGKNVDEAKTIIESKANEMYKKPAVIVKLVNKSVTVIGELNRPGQYTFIKNRMTIFEALGMAGDLNDFGNRKDIKLLRNIDGKERMVSIDITATDIIASEYYWIFPNDVLYVPPRNKVFGSKTLPFTGVIGVTVSIISTIISVVALTQ